MRQMPIELGDMATSWVNYIGLQACVCGDMGLWQESGKEEASNPNYPHLNWLLFN